jgi:hypothetical protein
MNAHEERLALAQAYAAAEREYRAAQLEVRSDGETSRARLANAQQALRVLEEAVERMLTFPR